VKINKNSEISFFQSMVTRVRVAIGMFQHVARVAHEKTHRAPKEALAAVAVSTVASKLAAAARDVPSRCSGNS
jgi:hypothetical protein